MEDASRFARDIQAHVLGIALLRVRLLASNSDDLTDDTDEMTEGMLAIAAVFAQSEKKRERGGQMRGPQMQKRRTGSRALWGPRLIELESHELG